jgi:uncharacterized protein YgiM (DUF1202 family)
MSAADKIIIVGMVLVFAVGGLYAVHTYFINSVLHHALTLPNSKRHVQEQIKVPIEINSAVNVYALNLRSAPSAEADVVTVLHKNDRVQIIDNTRVAGNWIKIRAGSYIGFVNADYLDKL